MLNGFDWIRRSRSGAELLAVLKYLETKPELLNEGELGPPHSALGDLCQRCWIYPRAPSPRQEIPSGTYCDRKLAPYCEKCRRILGRAGRLGGLSRHAIVIWGFTEPLPKQLANGEGFHDARVLGTYIRDENHFLLMMQRRELKAWFQELLIYHGNGLKGLIQVLPTTGASGGLDMSDVLCRAIHQEARFPMDRLRVRFFSAPHQILRPRVRDRLGLVTFEAAEFLSLLEMAAVFRTVLLPDAQQALFELLNLEETSEEQFYWGRFLGYLSPEAKDMLNAWKIRRWPKERIKFLYELTRYVAFYETH